MIPLSGPESCRVTGLLLGYAEGPAQAAAAAGARPGRGLPAESPATRARLRLGPVSISNFCREIPDFSPNPKP
jgi:hypothetical protein